MPIDRDIEKQITDAGFELARSKKHRVYKDDLGRILVTGATPSDRRAGENILHDLNKVLESEPWAPATAPEAEEVPALSKQPKKKSAGKGAAAYSGTGVTYYKPTRPMPSAEHLALEKDWSRLRDRLRKEMFEFEKELRRIFMIVYELAWYMEARHEMAINLFGRRKEFHEKIRKGTLVNIHSIADLRVYNRTFISRFWRQQPAPKFPLAAMLIARIFEGAPVLKEKPNSIENYSLNLWLRAVMEKVYITVIPKWLVATYEANHATDEIEEQLESVQI